MDEAIRARLEGAEKVFRANPNRREARRRYARALVAAGDADAADALLRAAMPARVLRRIDRAVRELLAERVGVSPETCRSRLQAGGMSNVAFLRHDPTPLGPLYTKVVALGRPHVRQEVAINRALITAGGPWREVTPRVYDVRLLPGTRLALITGEFFSSQRPPAAEGFGRLLELLLGYASPAAAAELRAALRPHERPGAPSWLDRSPREWPWIGGIHLLQPQKISVRLLRWLDTRVGSLALFDWMQRRIRTLLPARHHTHAREVAQAWQRHRSWRRIDPTHDHTLAHGDYGLHNVIHNPSSDRSVVIDFNSLMAAPPTIDLARILAPHPYQSDLMQHQALPHLQRHAPNWLWNPTQRLLFHTALIAHKLWFVKPLSLATPEEDLEPLLVALHDAIAAE